MLILGVVCACTAVQFGCCMWLCEGLPCSCAGVEWVDREACHGNYVWMVPLHHERLLRAAAEAGHKRWRRG